MSLWGTTGHWTGPNQPGLPQKPPRQERAASLARAREAAAQPSSAACIDHVMRVTGMSREYIHTFGAAAVLDANRRQLEARAELQAWVRDL